MFCKINLKGPMGLFPCVFIGMLFLTTTSHAQPVQSSTGTLYRIDPPESLPTSPVAARPKNPAAAYSMYKGRPASVAINSIEISGDIFANDTIFRSWSQRATPITIRYPGIDLASGVFQDKALAKTNAFNNWLAEKWMERNARCNHVFQRDPQDDTLGKNDESLAPQCMELNRPTKDLIANCKAPSTAQYHQNILRLRWSCTLAPSTAAVFYDEAIPNLPGGIIATAVNPASEERSRIPIETLN